MKKFLFALMCLSLVVGFTACGDEEETVPQNQQEEQGGDQQIAGAATITMDAPTISNGKAYFRAVVSNPHNYDINVGICYLFEGMQDASIIPTAESGSGYMKITLEETSSGVWEGETDLAASRLLVRAYVKSHSSNRTAINYSNLYYVDKTEGGNIDYSKFSLADPQAVSMTSTSITVQSQIQGITGQEDANAFIGGQSGFCYALSGAPTINDNIVDCTQYTFNNQGALYATIEGLQPNTRYAIAAFLKYSNGTVIYSNWFECSTQNGNSGGGDNPEGFSYSVTNVTSNSVTLSLEAVINDNNYPTEGAICYSSTETTPTKENSPFRDVMEEMMAGNGKCTITLSDLQPKTTYYIRPYWKRNDRVEYFETKTITTAE